MTDEKAISESKSNDLATYTAWKYPESLEAVAMRLAEAEREHAAAQDALVSAQDRAARAVKERDWFRHRLQWIALRDSGMKETGGA